MSQALLAPAGDPPREATIAFDGLYRANRDDVYAYAAGLMRDRTAAEDVTATTFERAYRNRGRFDPARGTARAWLFGIARNAALDELRRRGRQTTLAVDPIDLASSAPVHPAEQNETRLVVANALKALTGRERELVALKFFAGLSNAEIGAVLEITESNAGTRLHRVLDKLREACNEAS